MIRETVAPIEQYQWEFLKAVLSLSVAPLTSARGTGERRPLELELVADAGANMGGPREDSQSDNGCTGDTLTSHLRGVPPTRS